MHTIFHSTEFGPLRRRIANLTQRTKKSQIRHQDDLLYGGVKTLQKLVEKVLETGVGVQHASNFSL